MATLDTSLAETDGTIPLDVVVNALAGAQIALVQWWLEQRQPYPPEIIERAVEALR